MPTTPHSAIPSPNPTTSRLESVMALSKKMGREQHLPGLLALLAKEASNLLSAGGASLLLLDRERCELFSFVSLDGAIIRFDARLGIAGSAVLGGKSINVADVQEDSRFYPGIDRRTKKRTRNLLAVPLRGKNGEVLGVLEIMNKKKGNFTQADEGTATVLADQAALAIETPKMVQELRRHQDQLLKENTQLGTEVEGRFETQNLMGMSSRMQDIVRLIDEIRDSSLDVLITGENGTGKELVAKAIHYNSPRANQPFVALNCAALPQHLVESELFGIEKGVATGVESRGGKFELANGGTLFLDEVGDLGFNEQAKILRVLQERTFERVGGRKVQAVDVRILAATNKKLDVLIQQGTFREDLYYRLRVVHIHTPALREIPEDIPLFATYFLNKYCLQERKKPKVLTPGAEQALLAYHWPGNVRELENEMKRLAATVRRPTISVQDLEREILVAKGPSEKKKGTGGSSLHEAVADFEQNRIQDALQECQYNQVQTAKFLGISRQGLIKKMKRYGITSR
ncbi:MAG: sigma-54-dependent Fis family transcriptional regulator [Nitrospirales bacterium]|nr:sigma-54-dependent Fis family transcriptional regulator [Nitrospirales bacterium]